LFSRNIILNIIIGKLLKPLIKIGHQKQKETQHRDDDFVFRKLRETAMNNIQRDTGFFQSSGKPVIFEGKNTLSKMPHNKLLNLLSELSTVSVV